MSGTGSATIVDDRHPLDQMSRERAIALIEDAALQLTPEEMEAGYRFCCEWDGLLLHGSQPEAQCCSCLKEWKEKHLGKQSIR